MHADPVRIRFHSLPPGTKNTQTQASRAPCVLAVSDFCGHRQASLCPLCESPERSIAFLPPRQAPLTSTVSSNIRDPDGRYRLLTILHPGHSLRALRDKVMIIKWIFSGRWGRTSGNHSIDGKGFKSSRRTGSVVDVMTTVSSTAVDESVQPSAGGSWHFPTYDFVLWKCTLGLVLQSIHEDRPKMISTRYRGNAENFPREILQNDWECAPKLHLFSAHRNAGSILNDTRFE